MREERDHYKSECEDSRRIENNLLDTIYKLRAELEELKQQRQGQGLLNVKLMREAAVLLKTLKGLVQYIPNLLPAGKEMRAVIAKAEGQVMAFDEEPDGDPHGECAQEIRHLADKLQAATTAIVAANAERDLIIKRVEEAGKNFMKDNPRSGDYGRVAGFALKLMAESLRKREKPFIPKPTPYDTSGTRGEDDEVGPA